VSERDSSSARYQVDPVVSCGDEADGAVLYNPDLDDTAMINLSGRALWAFLQAPRTLDEMAAYLVQRYRDVTIERATADAAVFVRALVPNFLLEVAGDA
jgi:hypothetical protein